MGNATRFSANSAIAWYKHAEDELADVLDVIPYCKDHENVWSPRLVTILYETCSLLDSLWKHQSSVANGHIGLYFNNFGQDVAFRWVVFWGEDGPIRLTPFRCWLNQKTHKAPEWWDAYNNAAKHSRFTEFHQATLARTVIALAGLFLAVIRCDECHDAVAHAGWLSGDTHNPRAWLSDDSPGTAEEYVAVESRLFSYPVGWCGKHIANRFTWEGPASGRFQQWFNAATVEVPTEE